MARLNISLIGLTLVCAYIATYIVRTGVVQSLHAFPDEGVGVPLIIFIGLCLAVTALGTASATPGKEPCAETPGRYMPLVLVCIFFLALALIILLATLWPVISKFMSAALTDGTPAKGLSAEAYNRACLPLFALLMLFLVFCPWLVQSWRNNVKILVALGLVVLGGLFFFQQLVAPYIEWEGPRGLTSPLASASAVAFMVSFGILLWKEHLLRRPIALAAHLVHLGVVLMALGVAFSGPCKVEVTQTVRIGETVEIEGFRFTLNELYAGQTPAYRFFEAEISIGKGDTELGILSPQRRTYFKRPDQNFLESATRFSLGTELYTALLGVDGSEGTGDLRLSLHPLVNWIWIGGTLLCIAPIVGLIRIRNRKRTES
jgi:cytochrome c-type biogenesis protein CcmF